FAREGRPLDQRLPRPSASPEPLARASPFVSRALLVAIALHVTGLVPQANHRARRVVLIAERAQARRTQQEESAVGTRLDPEPSTRQHADEMTAREQQHVSPNSAYALDH